ncbi:unnamed protein product, partial [Allacma fusca]
FQAMILNAKKAEEFIFIAGITIFILFPEPSDCAYTGIRLCEDRRKLPGGACSPENDTVSATSFFPQSSSPASVTKSRPTFPSQTVTVTPLALPEAINFSQAVTKLASTTFSATSTTPRSIPSEPSTQKVSQGEGDNHEEKYVINDAINDALLEKENLLHPKPVEEESEEFVCTFTDELHYLGTSPICAKPQFTVEDTENDLESRQKRSILGQRTPLTPEEQHQLRKLYGRRFDLEAAERVKSMGESIELRKYKNRILASASEPDEYPSEPQLNGRKERSYTLHRRYPYQVKSRGRNRRQGLRKNLRGQMKLQEDPESTPNKTELIKLLLEELTKEEEEEEEEDVRKPRVNEQEKECSLYGTWLSPLAGVAIELQPVEGTVRVVLEDLPFAKQRLITSSWAGSVMISPVTPTTLTLLLQETSLPPGQDSPGTAVFTGQCVSCKGGAAIQGTWVIFSRHPECSQSMDSSNGSSGRNTSAGLFE